jgi:CRP-like cAMP-binding protein
MTHRRVGAQVRLRLSQSHLEFSPSSPTAPENRLLGLLPPAVLARLTPHLESVHLRRKDVLFRANETLRVCYFPSTAVVSLVSTLESGDSLEVGIVGRDGLAGTSVFPGIFTMSCDGIVQFPGVAHRISTDVLRAEVLANEVLYSTLGRFAQVLLVRSMQVSVCNMFHPVEQRCIRWLLTVSDLIANGDLPLTHDLMATMLGVHRPTVTLVLRSLDKAGLVSESRGRIVIRDRRRLERSCCECYRSMRNEQHRLLGY